MQCIPTYRTVTKVSELCSITQLYSPTLVFNFWEPLHYLDRGYGFQTWEVSPVYAIRSWAYIILHFLPARISALLLGPNKVSKNYYPDSTTFSNQNPQRPSFFAVRIILAVASVLCEANLHRAVVTKVNERVGRYLFFMLLASAGMWNASTGASSSPSDRHFISNAQPAFLPSTFAMYANTLAFTFSLSPPSADNGRRTLLSTLLFATGAIVGWPFSLALSIPFIIEELCVLGVDRITSSARTTWLLGRWKRLFTAGLIASLIFVSEHRGSSKSVTHHY